MPKLARNLDIALVEASLPQPAAITILGRADEVAIEPSRLLHVRSRGAASPRCYSNCAESCMNRQSVSPGCSAAALLTVHLETLDDATVARCPPAILGGDSHDRGVSVDTLNNLPCPRSAAVASFEDSFDMLADEVLERLFREAHGRPGLFLGDDGADLSTSLKHI